MKKTGKDGREGRQRVIKKKRKKEEDDDEDAEGPQPTTESGRRIGGGNRTKVRATGGSPFVRGKTRFGRCAVAQKATAQILVLLDEPRRNRV